MARRSRLVAHGNPWRIGFGGVGPVFYNETQKRQHILGNVTFINETSGQDFSVDQAESITLLDAQAQGTLFVASASESKNHVDSSSTISTFPASQSEAKNHVDSQDATLDAPTHVDEAKNHVDTQDTTNNVFNPSIHEFKNHVDTQSVPNNTFNVSVTEAKNHVDTQTAGGTVYDVYVFEHKDHVETQDAEHTPAPTVFPAGGGGGGAAGIFGLGEAGQDGQVDGTGGYGGAGDLLNTPRQTTPGTTGNTGTEFIGPYGSGSGGSGGNYNPAGVGQDGGAGGVYGGGGGGGGGGTGGGGQGALGGIGVIYIEYNPGTGSIEIVLTGSGTFTFPLDWTSSSNTIIVIGPGGCGSDGTVTTGGNGGGGGDATFVTNTALFHPGDVLSYDIPDPATACAAPVGTGTQTTFGNFSAASGINGDKTGGGTTVPFIPPPGSSSGGTGNHSGGSGGPGGDPTTFPSLVPLPSVTVCDVFDLFPLYPVPEFDNDYQTAVRILQAQAFAQQTRSPDGINSRLRKTTLYYKNLVYAEKDILARFFQIHGFDVEFFYTAFGDIEPTLWVFTGFDHTPVAKGYSDVDLSLQEVPFIQHCRAVPLTSGAVDAGAAYRLSTAVYFHGGVLPSPDPSIFEGVTHSLPDTADTFLMAGWCGYANTAEGGYNFFILFDNSSPGMEWVISVGDGQTIPVGEFAIDMTLYDNTGVQIFDGFVRIPVDIRSGWHSFAISGQMSTQTIQVMVDLTLYDFLDAESDWYSTLPIGSPYGLGGTLNGDWQFGATAVGPPTTPGEPAIQYAPIVFGGLPQSILSPGGPGMAWSIFRFGMGEPFYDLTNSTNVGKLFAPGNHPVDWGLNGQLPTGLVPAFYFYGNYTNYGYINRGLGWVLDPVDQGPLTPHPPPPT